jgi:hypothetical protein
MRPEGVVLLYEKDKLWGYELFYSWSKAERALRRASREGVLEREDGGYSGTSGPTNALIVDLRTLLWTQKERWRKSLLNLRPEEVAELGARFDLPLCIIEAISQAERDTLERNRYHLSKYNELTTALMRKYLPRPVLKYLFYGW